MQHKRLKLSTVLLFALGFTGIQAQEAVTVSGGNASGNGGSVAYSVGQVVYTTNTGVNGSVAQGVQQTFEILVATGIEEAKGISLLVEAYPNPTTDYLILNVDASNSLNINSLSYKLYDTNSKLIAVRKLEGNQTRIAMGNLVPETYFLKVCEGNKEVKTFKIIKN